MSFPYTYESFETSTFWAVVGRVGSIATLIAVAAAIWWWRRAHPIVVAGVSASVFQVTTAGHGAQYLAWPVPFTTQAPTRLHPLLQGAIGVWAWWAYVGLGANLVPASWGTWPSRIGTLSSLAMVVLIVMALPWQQRGAAGPIPALPAAGTAESGVGRRHRSASAGTAAATNSVGTGRSGTTVPVVP